MTYKKTRIPLSNLSGEDSEICAAFFKTDLMCDEAENQSVFTSNAIRCQGAEDTAMKLSNGCWLQKENVGCFSPAHVYAADVSDRRVRLCCPTARIEKRGDTLGGINLTVEVTSPMAGMLRVRTTHHADVKDRGRPLSWRCPSQLSWTRKRRRRKLLSAAAACAWKSERTRLPSPSGGAGKG